MYIHICIHTYKLIYICIYSLTERNEISASSSSTLYIYIYIYLFIYLYIYIYICMFVHILTYIASPRETKFRHSAPGCYIYIYINIFIYIYIYIYICMFVHIFIYIASPRETKFRHQAPGCSLQRSRSACWNSSLWSCRAALLRTNWWHFWLSKSMFMYNVCNSYLYIHVYVYDARGANVEICRMKVVEQRSW